MELQANLNWKQNQGIVLPQVSVNLSTTETNLCVHFKVIEPIACFHLQHTQDNAPCYEDSCVEIFLLTPSGEYFNFEFNSIGHCLAAKGKNRENRTLLSNEVLQNIFRKTSISPTNSTYSWELEAKIPYSLLGLTKNDSLKGNLYKCADKSKTPHYLSLFPIDTEKPDFHRPEFFKPLLIEKQESP